MKRILKTRLGKIVTGILVLGLILAGVFLGYVSDYYRADGSAAAMLQKSSSISVQSDHIVLSPDPASDTALIFYPGGKVEFQAYLPLLEKISQTSGINCILVKMPFNLAVFRPGAAEAVMAQYPDIKTWYIGGHSLGGAMASDYAQKHPDKISGLILLGAYRYGSYPVERTLTVYGSLNTSVAQKVDYTENVVIIEGGNHAQFGNYGPQAGDPAASISALEQQAITAAAVRNFLDKMRN